MRTLRIARALPLLIALVLVAAAPGATALSREARESLERAPAPSESVSSAVENAAACAASAGASCTSGAQSWAATWTAAFEPLRAWASGIGPANAQAEVDAERAAAESSVGETVSYWADWAGYQIEAAIAWLFGG